MAIDKAVDSAQLNADLTAVADAIRTKGGTSDALAFPDGFVEAVGAIQAGGGGDNETLIALVNGTLTDFVAPEGAGEIRNQLFYGATNLKTADVSNVTRIGIEAFRGCTALESVVLPDKSSHVAPILARAFYGCVKLTSAQSLLEGQATSSCPGIFQNCTALKRVDMPNYFAGIQMFNGCTALEFVRLKRATMQSQMFLNCAALKTIVFTGDVLSEFASNNAFQGTPFASGGTGGTVYVKQALIEDYKAATNWAALYEAGTVTFMPIEGSEYE